MALPNRKLLIKQVFEAGVLEALTASSGASLDNSLDNCAEQLTSLISKRYVGPRDTKVPKSDAWYVNILPEYDDKRFKSCIRMTRKDFANVLGLISVNPVFNCNANNVMLPVEKQLAIAVYRFGCDGSGVSYWKVAQHFGVSDGGTIRNCTDRVIKALIDLEKDYIKWPDSQERMSVTKFMEDRLPKCIGYMDGCHVNLFQAPIHNHESYYSRKQEYGIQLQAICGNDLSIRHLHVGFPASVHDSRVYANTSIGLHPERYLENGQWIAADSAYQLTEFVLTPFRENATLGTPKQRKQFNYHFSGYRVHIEQVFGILKAVFGSLRRLRIRIDKDTGHKRAVEWIVACCVLYNITKPSYDDVFVKELKPNEEEEDPFRGPALRGGGLKRKQLFNWYHGITTE